MRYLAGSAVCLVACASKDAPTWHQDVAPIVDAYCVDCHADGGIAPFPMDSPQAVSQLAPAVAEVVGERIMPPYYAERGHTPLAYDRFLTDAQIDTVLAWLEADAPLGDADEPGDAIEVQTGGLSRFDVTLQPDEPYTPQLSPDDYHCFVLDWPETEPKFVTGFEVLPGNPVIDHHVVAYAIGPSQADQVLAFDDMDPGPGYECFGSAAHSRWEPDSLVDQLRQVYLGAWTPGVTGLEFANGQRIEPGSKIVLQVHYFTLGNEGEVDQTAVRLKLDDAVDAEAFYMPWMNILWPAGGSMQIPAGRITEHEHQASPFGSLNLDVFAGGEDFSDGMLLHSVFAHMHVLGRRMTYTVHRADGSEQVLLNVPRYDFDWQQEYVFAEPVLLMPGDELSVECEFDNTAEWIAEKGLGEPVDVDWGEGSLDEMCVAHTRITHP